MIYLLYSVLGYATFFVFTGYTLNIFDYWLDCLFYWVEQPGWTNKIYWALILLCYIVLISQLLLVIVPLFYTAMLCDRWSGHHDRKFPR